MAMAAAAGEGDDEEAQEWRLTVNTEGFQTVQFKLPCGDGSLTILELTQKVAERCQRMAGGWHFSV